MLRVLVDEFLPGRYYSEPEVVRILGRFHADHAALRRHLVEERLLDRANASRTYWRGGGPGPEAWRSGSAEALVQRCRGARYSTAAARLPARLVAPQPAWSSVNQGSRGYDAPVSAVSA